MKRLPISPIIITGIISIVLFGGLELWQNHTPVKTVSVSPKPSATPTATETVIKPQTTTLIQGDLYLSQGSGKATVYKIAPDGAKQELFSYPTEYASKVSASADGSRIAYSDASWNIQLYDTVKKRSTLVKAAVGSTDKDPSGGVSYSDPVVSPDGKHIVAGAGYWEGSDEVYTESNGENYGSISACNKGSIAWSPDSSQFAIASGLDRSGGQSACLYVAKASAPNAGKNLLPKDKEGNSKDSFTPSWSPDGKMIAFSYEYLGTQNQVQSTDDSVWQHRGIYVVNADGTNFKEVTSNQSFSSAPVWLDASTILYGLTNTWSGGDKGIYSIKFDGSKNTQLYKGDFSNYGGLQMLPGNGAVLFQEDSHDGSFIASPTGRTYELRTEVLNVTTEKLVVIDSRSISDQY